MEDGDFIDHISRHGLLNVVLQSRANCGDKRTMYQPLVPGQARVVICQVKHTREEQENNNTPSSPFQN